MSDPFSIVIADDDPDVLTVLGKYLENPQYRVLLAENGSKALEILEREEIRLVISDLIMPGVDGLKLTEAVKRKNPDIPVLIMTAYGSIETAVHAMRVGASDYVTKPVNPEEFKVKVAKALEQYDLHREVTELKQDLSRSTTIAEVVGDSPAMRKVLNLVALVAKRDVPVVLIGESGTGKEVLAQVIHNASPRAKNSFVAISCGAVPETLLESELFGYLKGAFTGAYAPKKGLFEEADGGTLFLDEIGDAPMSIQTKLLRAVQEGEIRRLGSTRTIPVNVRILAATNKDLGRQVETREFRDDLFYRLSVVTIRIPPLVERKEDIPLLADHFLKIHGPKINGEVKGITADARFRLMSYSWPGNVRELENMIRRALVVARGEMIAESDLFPAGLHVQGGWDPDTEGMNGKDEGSLLNPLSEAQHSFHDAYFRDALTRTSGNIRKVAELAGISRKNVYEHLRRLDIDPADFRRRS